MDRYTMKTSLFYAFKGYNHSYIAIRSGHNRAARAGLGLMISRTRAARAKEKLRPDRDRPGRAMISTGSGRSRAPNNLTSGPTRDRPDANLVVSDH